MALNIVTNPASNSSANDPIIWKLQLTVLGSAPIEKRVTYYVADSAGTRISEIYVWTPKSTSEILQVDVNHILKGITSSAFPTCSVTPVVDTSAIKSVKLYYAENSFDTSTCIDTPGAYSQSSLIYVINSALNYENISAFDLSGGKTGALMNSYPTRMYWSPDSEPYAHYYGTGTVKITFYNAAGANISSTTHTMTGANTAKYVSLDWRCYSVSSAPASALLEVNDGTGWKSYIISMDVCSCRGFYTGLSFLDPLGGRSSVSIKCPSELNIIRTGTEIYSFSPTITTKGRGIVNPGAKEDIKISVQLGHTNEDLLFAKGLLGSPGHHLLKMSKSGVKTWFKFILEAGSISVIKEQQEIEIQLKGTLAEDYSGQSIDI
ncbi:MAG: hypothetical protein ABI851_12145 [Saprospiraceae bacterium]